MYDNATKTITSYINVITEKQSKIIEYVNKTYKSVKVNVEG